MTATCFSDGARMPSFSAECQHLSNLLQERGPFTQLRAISEHLFPLWLQKVNSSQAGPLPHTRSHPKPLLRSLDKSCTFGGYDFLNQSSRGKKSSSWKHMVGECTLTYCCGPVRNLSAVNCHLARLKCPGAAADRSLHGLLPGQVCGTVTSPWVEHHQHHLALRFAQPPPLIRLTQAHRCCWPTLAPASLVSKLLCPAQPRLRLGHTASGGRAAYTGDAQPEVRARARSSSPRTWGTPCPFSDKRLRKVGDRC